MPKKANVTKVISKAESYIQNTADIHPEVHAILTSLLGVLNILTTAKVKKNSTNSNIPSSQNPLGFTALSNDEDNESSQDSDASTKPEKRKPGGQKGHKGSNLSPLSDPDEIVNLSVDELKKLPGVSYYEGGYEERQVFEMTVERKVIAYRAQVLVGSDDSLIKADFPDHVTERTQYGASVKAHALYMIFCQMLPYNRVRDHFVNNFGIHISLGTLVNFGKVAYMALEPFEAYAKKMLLEGEVLHVDETGINIKGFLMWMHSASNDRFVLQIPHAKRGNEATQDMDILPHFKGLLVHDNWASYFAYACVHVLCNAHQIRELQLIIDEENYTWAKNMQALLREICHEVNETEAGYLDIKRQEDFLRRYREILRNADQEMPPPKTSFKKNGELKKRTAQPKARVLMNRLMALEEETLRFMKDPLAPFTNNEAERCVRMVKVHQKVAGCFRSFGEAEVFCRMRSYILSTMKHGIKPIDALNLLAQATYPTPFLPALQSAC